MTKKRTRRGRRLARAHRDKLLRWYKSVPSLVDQASDARQRANSYRKFDVGASALGVLIDGTFREYAGANKKRRAGPRSDGDECAEMEILNAAKLTQCVEIVGMVVIAPHQPDDYRGVDLGVTISCAHCRQMFRRETQDRRSPLKMHTRIMFVNAHDQRRVELRVDKILKLCE